MSPLRRVAGKALTLLGLAMVAAALASCGGGGSAASSSVPSTSIAREQQDAQLGQANVVRVYIDGGPTAGVNAPNAIYADVMVCAPGTSNCATVDHMRVDTGSSGVRVFASALPAALLSALPQQTSDGGAVAGECSGFVTGTVWGGVRRADVHLNRIGTGTTAANVPIQVINDPEPKLSAVPSGCSAQGELYPSMQALSAKGVLGIGLSPNDCGTYCETRTPPVYFDCPTAGKCTSSSMAARRQVLNPVMALPTHNNGTSILFADQTGPFLSAEGLLILGIGTADNNALASNAAPLATNQAGNFSAELGGQTLNYSFIDSGSAFNYVPPGAPLDLPNCDRMASLFCPGTELTVSITTTGLFATKTSSSLLLASATDAASAFSGYSAIPGLAAVGWDGSLDLGASFFFGRQVYTLIDGKTAAGFPGPGPAFAHTP